MLLSQAAARLSRAGSDTPRLDAEVLLADALGVRRERLILDARRELDDPEALARFEAAIARRERHEPVAYITGRRAFRHLELYVDQRVLIPRPETELLVEAALSLPAGARVVDVGTGSGAVALALKDERPDLEVIGTDISEDAILVSCHNAHEMVELRRQEPRLGRQGLRREEPRLGRQGLRREEPRLGRQELRRQEPRLGRQGLDVEWVHGDLLAGVTGRIDAVLANLPYVAADDALPPDVSRYEPREALFAGPDGLEVIRRLIGALDGVPFVALEVGAGQAPAVEKLLRAAGFAEVERRRDLAGHERVVVGRR